MDALSYFSFPTRVTFGWGAVAQVSAQVVQWGKQRPCLVTDAGVAGLPFVAALTQQLRAAHLQPVLFPGVHANPIESDVVQAAALYREHRCDCIIAIGGGSPMDAAKAVALAVSVDRPLFDFVPGGAPIPEILPPILAIPTTAGTGSEVGRAAVISENGTGIKHILFAPSLLPRAVFSDPALTVGLPPKWTAITGMDALTHNVEAFVARGYHPICDGVALEGVRRVAQFLPRAFADGTDREARTEMLAASMMGAVAFQKGLGVTHSLAHPLTTVADVPHGLANAIALPAALRFNASVAADRLAFLARHIGWRDATAAGFVDFVCNLQRRLSLPTRLREVGVNASMLDRLVALAAQDGCHADNPRAVTAEDFRALYTELM